MITAEGVLKLDKTVKTAVTVGKFDGLHKGHRLLIDRIASKKPEGLLGVVVSIEERQEKAKLLLPEETGELLESLGIDAPLRLFLDPDVRDLGPEVFIKRYLAEMLHASFIALGNDFSFGKGRAGNAKTLEEAGERYGFETEVLRRISEDGEIISSAAIREAIREGNVRKAGNMLGYPYFISASMLRKNRTDEDAFIRAAFPKGRVVPCFGRYLAEISAAGETKNGSVLIGPGAGNTPEILIRREDLQAPVSGSVRISFLDDLGSERK